LGSIKFAQRRVLKWLFVPLIAAPVVGFLAGWLQWIEALVMGCAILAGWAALRREYLRSILLIYAKSRTLLHVDITYAAVSLIGVAGALLLGHGAVIGAVLSLAGAAYLAALQAETLIGRDPGWLTEPLVDVWPKIRQLGFWSMIGAVIYWLFGQSYNYLLATRLDLRAVADVNATRLLLMPAFVVTIGISSLLNPIAARWYFEVGVRKTVRRLVLFLGGVALIDIVYFAVIWVFRDWAVHDLMHKNIHDQDLLLVLWASVVLAGLARDMLQCALFALGRMRAMAWQIGVSAAVALIVTWFGFTLWGEAAVLVGQVVGELINLAFIVLLLKTHVRRVAQE